MVSKASEDLPEPDKPVNTISASRGISRSTFFRLCSRAPRTWIVLWASPTGVALPASAGDCLVALLIVVGLAQTSWTGNASQNRVHRLRKMRVLCYDFWQEESAYEPAPAAFDSHPGLASHGA